MQPPKFFVHACYISSRNFHAPGPERAAERGPRRDDPGRAVAAGVASAAMRRHPARALPAVASVLAAALAVAGCSAATAAAGPASSTASRTTTSSATGTARASAPVYGPPAPDPACTAAL